MPLSLIHYSQIAVILLLLIIQLWKRSLLEKMGRWFFYGTIAMTTALLFYYSHLQFTGWLRSGPPSVFLIPPYQDIGYFLFYVLMRFWAQYLLSGAVALLFLFAMRYGNRRWQERFFYPDEPHLIALSIFVMGNPLWIGYLLVTLVAYSIYVLARRIYTRRDERVTFYYFWLPTAILCLGALPFLSKWQDFTLLKF